MLKDRDANGINGCKSQLGVLEENKPLECFKLSTQSILQQYIWAVSPTVSQLLDIKAAIKCVISFR